MHLLQMGMAGLPTLLGVRVAIVKSGRRACGCGASVLLKVLLASNVCVWCDEDERKMREAGEILIYLRMKSFSVCCYTNASSTQCVATQDGSTRVACYPQGGESSTCEVTEL
jgi:hypothetical protein